MYMCKILFIQYRRTTKKTKQNKTTPPQTNCTVNQNPQIFRHLKCASFLLYNLKLDITEFEVAGQIHSLIYCKLKNLSPHIVVLLIFYTVLLFSYKQLHV